MTRRPGLLALVYAASILLLSWRPATATDATLGDKGDDRRILVLLHLPPAHFRPNGDYGGDYGDEITHSARERAAERIARRYGLKLVTNWPMPLLGVDCFVMSVPEGVPAAVAAEKVSHAPGVSSAEPMHIYIAQSASPTPNDPLFAAQPAARAWRLADLHQLATGHGVTIAVIDSKIESTHPDLERQISTTKDFVADHPSGPEDHGTGVAGIIAARPDNGVGIVGVAPAAHLMALRACWQLARMGSKPGATICDSLSLAKALYFAVEHKAAIINLSLSGPPDTLLAQIVRVGLSRGTVIVAAYDPTLPRGGFPASLAGVIPVSDRTSPLLPPEVYMAPGRDTPTTQPGGRWNLVNGNSFSAAHVSGLMALVLERRATGGSFGIVRVKGGGGAIDACATLLGTSSRCDCACARPS